MYVYIKKNTHFNKVDLIKKVLNIFEFSVCLIFVSVCIKHFSKVILLSNNNFLVFKITSVAEFDIVKKILDYFYMWIFKLQLLVKFMDIIV